MKRTPLFFIITFTLLALALMPSARTEVNPGLNPTLQTVASIAFKAAPFTAPAVTLTSPFNNAISKEVETAPSSVQLNKSPISFAGAPPILLLPPLCTPQTGLIISEFRFRGAAGPNDEFVELYNSTDTAITVCTADGSAGWAVAARNAAATSTTTVFVVPNGTVIPARGHYLGVNNSASGYSLGSYPSGVGTTATGDTTYAIGIDDNAGIALFNTANSASFSSSTRLDAIGFSGPTGAIADLYREGAGFSQIGIANGQYSFIRRLASGLPVDANDNATDLWFLSTTAGNFGGSITSALGAPGPENLTSPVLRNSVLPSVMLDATVASSVAPNRVRDLTSDPANNSTQGTMAWRRRVVNNSGAPVTRLRLHVTAITTYPPPNGTTADLRVRSVGPATITNVNDAATCAANGTPSTPPCTVSVLGTTLEEPPTQAMGGGYNSTVTVALPQPLAPGASVAVQFMVGVQQGGSFSFFFNHMALPPGNAPAAPSNLTATSISHSQINLAWVDNSNDETGFKIERKTGPGGTYSQIATVGANVGTYNNSGLSSNTQYYYRVRATNASGDSVYSTENNATTWNFSPSVSLTTPSNNQIFTAPANISLTANASDSDGTISKVQFFQGTTLLNEDTSAPFSFNWNNVATGNYSLTAKAFDNAGATTTSTPVAITVNALPTVNLIAPANGQIFSAPANITLTASASDSDGTVSKVQFFQGTTLLNEDTTLPYSFTWNNVAAGSYSLTAKTFDNLGGTATSAAVAITVNSSPTVSLTAPTNGQVFSAPANITLTASASDSDGTVSKVQFFQGTTLLNEDTAAPFSFNWNNVAAGNYSLTAKAFDNAGATTTSTAVSIVVNQPPAANAGGPYTAMTSQAVQFNGSASFDSDGSITSYAWNFGDNTSGSGVSPSHTYASVGSYTVTLTVTDNLGSQASATTTATITTNGMEQYSANFSQWALLRQPNSNESLYWNDIFRSAYQHGQEALLLAGREFGRTIFDSAEYAARNRSNRDYVYDLYKTYLMREPDQQGWDGWTATVATHGREQVRGGFEFSGEWMNLMATMTATGSITSAVSSLSSARVAPKNQPGNGLLARDTEWSLPLLSLPGRAGLDLGLSLSYSSMVWTRSGPYLHFDEDGGSPSPGFRLGFPTIQGKFFDALAGKNIYLLLTSEGRRVSLRQVGSSNIYEAGDSSYLQLIENGSLILRTTDGTQLNYGWFNLEFRCTQIKDRNGNYLTINYNSLGDITTITDTLGRVITFNYDTNANPISITQTWNGQTHQWATFGWGTHTMQSSFSGVSVVGAANGSIIPVLTQVGLHDSTRYTFEYTAAGQVSVIRSFRSDNVQRAYIAYDYESTPDDCPRLSATRVSALNWTGINGVPSEVVTQYSAPGDGSHQMITPDGTLYKEFYGGTGGSPAWQEGLLLQSEVWSAGVRQKWTTLNWTQDNTTVNYQTNPRMTESNVYDASGNRRRVTVDYGIYAQYGLPYLVREYAADGVTEIRHSFTDYNLSQAYLDRRIIGLVSEVHVTDVASWQTKITYGYDDPARLQPLPAAATQHDQSYSASFTTRGNVTSVSRWDVTDIINPSKALTTQMTYNVAGSVVSSADPSGHQNSVSYVDSFSDGNNGRNTFAYPTTFTDADGFSSYVQYNFDFGARMRVQGPPPANQPQGLIQTFTYDGAARVERVTTTNNGAYTRFVHGPDYVQSFTTVNTVADEAYVFQMFDGAGRIRVAGRNHPGSIGGYSAQQNIYDSMGNRVKQSNPTEVTGAWLPTGDDAAGWLYTQQTYDWQGRPLVTTNPDGTTKEVSYAGCGCAGGEVVTLTDEGTLDGGVAKRRQQKIYSDILGRTIKTEVLNWQGGSVYSATVNTYNARDQITLVRQYQGPEGGTSYQDTSVTYDGYGRLKTKHVPEQDNGTATIYNYNADDTVFSVTDARGAVSTFGYNNRHSVTSVSFAAPSGITVPIPVNISYDSVGNRTLMTDNSGNTSYQYNQLSQLTSEVRTFAGLSGSYSLVYEYNLAGHLKKVTDPTNVTVNYNYNQVGLVESVTGENNLYGGVFQYATGISYRAWGGIKGLTYGNNYTSSILYNSRLQGTMFEVAGRPAQYGPSTVMKAQYQYYSDGSLKYAQNHMDERFDRAYGYDHVARVKEAYSGSESRDYVNGSISGMQSGPYRQSYQHDAFGNMTSLNNRFWSQTDAFTASYPNNRRQGFSYDADGRLTQDSDLQYSYDAAGRNASIFSAAANRTIASLQDGNGWVTKRTESFGGTVTNTTTYYVKSSVLGGRVVTELNQNGVKQKGYVYAGDQVLAEQENNVVIWKYTTPLTGSRGGASADGQFNAEAEFDSMGVNVGFADPFIEPLGVPVPEPFTPMLFPDQGGCGSNPNCTRCSLDGFEIGCDQAMHLLDIGAANLQVTLNNGQRITVPVQSFGVGIFRIWIPDADNPRGPGYQFDDDVIRTNTFQDDLMGHWETFSFNFGPPNSQQHRHHPSPQEPAKPSHSKRDPCATPNSIVELFRNDFEAQWRRTTQSGEENGSLLFYEQANNTYPRVTLSEGRHLTDRITSVPAMPEIGPETRKAFDDFQKAGRSVYFLAIFHTHPNFPYSGESRSGNPSGADIQYQSDHRNVLGILRTGKGYSFFSNGKTFWPNDPRANECIWILNNKRN